MLVRQLSTISPAMTLLAALETTRLHRGAGLTGNCTVLVSCGPFGCRIIPSPMRA